ncbi:MAG: MerR family transcriptional regulator [Eubacteriales bacterium]|nr:MerR family transcriptional regulator [Eubacteriales bacterium]
MKYKTSELAKLLNVSTNTVRRYEEKGYIHAVRDENTSYRYYSEDCVFGIVNAGLLRKYGFSHEELDEMQKYDLKDTIDAYRNRLKAMDEKIEYLTYVRHRIKDDLVLMEKARGLHNIYEKDCVNQTYVLYQSGERLLNEPGRMEKVQQFVYDAPEVQRIYIIRKEDIQAGKLTINIGWSIKNIDMEKYNIESNEYTEHYATKRSVMGMVKLPVKYADMPEYTDETLREQLLGNHLKYIKKNNLKIAGDVKGVVITRALENNVDMMYLLMGIPVEDID